MGSLSSQVMLRQKSSLNLYPLHYTMAFASSRVSYSHTQQRALRFHLPIRADIRAYYVPHKLLYRYLRSIPYTGGATFTYGHVREPSPVHLLFWFKLIRPFSSFPSRCCRCSLMLIIVSNPSPHPVEGLPGG